MILYDRDPVAPVFLHGSSWVVLLCLAEFVGKDRVDFQIPEVVGEGSKPLVASQQRQSEAHRGDFGSKIGRPSFPLRVLDFDTMSDPVGDDFDELALHCVALVVLALELELIAAEEAFLAN